MRCHSPATTERKAYIAALKTANIGFARSPLKGDEHEWQSDRIAS